MLKTLPADQAFLSPPETELCELQHSKVVIQQLPYEHTSSYHEGSYKGPAAIVEASHYVEFYDEEIDAEAYKSTGVATLEALNFEGAFNEQAMDKISQQTAQLLALGKFVISLGAEHTVTGGIAKAFKEKYPNFCILQIDAHSDLRMAYQDNPYSHASVMARVHEMGIPLVQVGIRAQCKEESELMKASDTITTFYAHQIHHNTNWISDCIHALGDQVYVSIDADGFDPSVAPAVGTAEPGGLSWFQGLNLLEEVAKHKNVIGFDIVEIAPRESDTLTEFTMAKLCYKFMGYLHKNNQI
jgi:agmatinase